MSLGNLVHFVCSNENSSPNNRKVREDCVLGFEGFVDLFEHRQICLGFNIFSDLEEILQLKGSILNVL